MTEVAQARGLLSHPQVWVTGALVLGLATSVGCTNPVDSRRTVSVRPELRTLSFDDLASSLGGGGSLFIYAAPSDVAFALEPGERVPLEAAVSSGDRESVGLYNVRCPSRDRLPRHFQCFRLNVAMKEGHVASELGSSLSAAGGRFVFIAVSGWFAAVVFYSPEDPIGRAKRVRSWPGVEYTELAPMACASPPCPSLTVPIPVDTGRAVIADGILQVRSGDTVSVRYRQPMGGILQARLPVP